MGLKYKSIIVRIIVSMGLILRYFVAYLNYYCTLAVFYYTLYHSYSLSLCLNLCLSLCLSLMSYNNNNIVLIL